jgi:hypothetical protein
MLNHAVVVTWYGGRTRTNETNRFGFGVLVTSDASGSDDWVGRDVYIQAENLVPLPGPETVLVGTVVESKKGLAMLDPQTLQTMLQSQPESAADILSRVLHVDTYVKYSPSFGDASVCLSDDQIVGMLRATQRRSARKRVKDRRYEEPGALDDIHPEHLECLFTNASVGLRLTHPLLAGLVQAQDVMHIRESAPPKRVPYELSAAWSRALSSGGARARAVRERRHLQGPTSSVITHRGDEWLSQARREVFAWRSSHPGRSESDNPLDGLLDIDIDDHVAEQAKRLPLRFRASHASWPRLISDEELDGIIMPLLLHGDSREALDSTVVDFFETWGDGLQNAHQILNGKSTKLEKGGATIHLSEVSGETALRSMTRYSAHVMSRLSQMSEHEQDVWACFLLHPRTILSRASYPEMAPRWDSVWQARLQSTNSNELMQRALRLHWTSNLNTLEPLLSRSEYSWVDSAPPESKVRLVYSLVSQNRQTILQAVGAHLDGAAGVLGRFAIAVWSGEKTGRSPKTESLIKELERVAASCLFEGRPINEHFTAIAPACLDHACAKVSFCEAKLKPPKDAKDYDTAEVWCGRVRGFRRPRTPNGVLSRMGWKVACAAGPLCASDALGGWTVAEFLDALQITRYPAYVIGPMDLAIRLGAWLNRVLEIEERLRCRTCQELMTQDFEFAKFDAVYRSTVLNCRHGEGHDQNVYLSHCWNCSSEKRAGLTFVDGRDCTIRFEHRDYPRARNYLLCMECGAGPDKKATGDPGLSEYELIGRLCPKCGVAVTKWRGTSMNRSCPSCNHQIRLTFKHFDWISNEVDKKKTDIWETDITSTGLDEFDDPALFEPPGVNDPRPVREPSDRFVGKARKR